MTVIQLRIEELTNAQLDRLVGQALGYEIDEYGENRSIRENGGAPTTWSPSTDWSQGGPIIEREQIIYRHHTGGLIEACVMTGEIGVNRKRAAVQMGPSLLVAAMRAFAAYKLGKTVELPA